MRKFVVALLNWMLEQVDPKVFSLDFYFLDGSSTHKVKRMNTQISDTGTVSLSAACISAAGNAVTGIPFEWSSSDPSVVTVTPSGDGSSAQVAATGKIGSATITVTAGNLSAVDTITVVAGAPASITLVEVCGT